MTQTLDRADGSLAGLINSVPELGTFAAAVRQQSAQAPAAPTEPTAPALEAAAAPDARAARGGRRRRLGRRRRERLSGPPAPAERAPRAAGMVKRTLAVAGLCLALTMLAAGAGYLTFPHAALFSRVHGTVLVALAPVSALGAIIAAVAAWNAACRLLQGRKSADVLTVLAAAVATIVSGTGMWAFFTVYVPTIPVLVRIPIFAFLEIATIASALRSRDNMREEVRRALAEGREPDTGLDMDGLAMWAFTCTSAFLASLASTTVAEAIFRLAPPLVAAWLWERALVSERRRLTSRKHKRDRSTWRISPERILVRIGLLDPVGKTLGEAAADRRITILALAVEQAAAVEAAGVDPADKRRIRAEQRLRTALRQAVEQADLATNRDRQLALVSQIRILRAPQDLVTLDTDSPWALLAGPRKRTERPEKADRPEHPERPEKHEHPENPERPQPPETAEGTTLAELAEALTAALRQQDADQVHALMAGRGDYAGLVHWLGRNGKFGAKRSMAVAAMYAVPETMTFPSMGAAWVAGLVPGKAGEIDKNEIRRLRELIGPVWTAQNYPGPAADGGGKDQTQE